jgi:hypothetical protein
VVDQSLLPELAADFAAYPDTYDLRGLETIDADTPANAEQDSEAEIDPVIARGDYLEDWYTFPGGRLKDNPSRDPDYRPKRRPPQIRRLSTPPDSFDTQISARENRALNRETFNFMEEDDAAVPSSSHLPSPAPKNAIDDFDFKDDEVGPLFGGTRQIHDDPFLLEDPIQPLSRPVSPVSSEASITEYLLNPSPTGSVLIPQPQFHSPVPMSLDQPLRAEDPVTQSNLSPARSGSVPPRQFRSPSPMVSDPQPQVESTPSPPDQPLEVSFLLLSFCILTVLFLCRFLIRSLCPTPNYPISQPTSVNLFLSIPPF